MTKECPRPDPAIERVGWNKRRETAAIHELGASIDALVIRISSFLSHSGLRHESFNLRRRKADPATTNQLVSVRLVGSGIGAKRQTSLSTFR